MVQRFGVELALLKIYVVFAAYDYEGEVLCGIYWTREAAQQRIDQMASKNVHKYADDIYIIEYNVDKDGGLDIS